MDLHEDLCYLGALELAERIRTREVSPVEVVRAHLARIEAVNPRVNALVTVIDDAERRARAAEAAVMGGAAVGPLHGVPFTVKDSLDTAGVRTTRGSRLFAAHVPDRDATVVARLTAAGAIPIAKSNVPEFSFWWETANLLFGRTVNPWDPTRSPGGSSGGEAAAIASGLSPLGIGSDIAVSIRGPAHYCGVVGLKPTHGRTPLTGHWPDMLCRFWHVGPMARRVVDVALALSLMAGPDGRDRYAHDAPVGDLHDLHGALPRLRIGWLAERGFGPVDAEVAATVARAAATLEALGCRVEPACVPGLERRDCNALTATLFSAAAGSCFAAIAGGRENDLHPATRRRLAAPAASLDQYVAADAEVGGLRRDLAAYFRDHDVLLCPVSPVPAFPHEATTLTIDGSTLPIRDLVRFTAPFNLTGSPAISVPFGWSRDGLPIGVQVVGRHFDEATILRVAVTLERRHDATRRHPPLAAPDSP